MSFWILRDRVPVEVDDLLIWGQWMEIHDNRRVALTIIEQPESDPVRVSTVFLGLDHNYSGVGPPVLFESMVFGGPLDDEQYRYHTWDEAAAGHALLTDEATIEGRVAAWEVRQQLQKIAAKV